MEEKLVPEIRFEGFDENLIKVTIGACVTELGDGIHGTPKYNEHGEYAFINGNNLVNSRITITNDTKYVNKTELKPSDFKLNTNTILMSINGTIGDLAFYNKEKVMLGKSCAYMNLGNINKKYFYYILQTKNVKNYFYKNLTGSTIKNLGLKTIENTPIYIVKNSEEQQQIGSLFKNLDKIIELEEEKHQKLLDFKEAMLQDMFPKEGEKVPKIRFDGFDDEWRVLQLKDLGQKYTSLTGKTKNDFGHGDGRYVTFSNVLANPVSSLDGVDKIEVDNSQNAVKSGDLFFNISSETYDEVGMSSVWTHDVENYYLNSFCMGFRPSVKMDNHFITYLLRSRSVRKQIMKLAQGISRINISQTKMMDIFLCIPSLEEQALIGNFFKNLDEKIELSEEKIEKIKVFKESLMDKMFI